MAKSSDVILVHGAWADGSSWAKVIPLLAARGHSVTAVQLPPDVSQRRRGDG
jgi:pimeloyl-ACP methyl ester carboxylesterase